MALGTAEFLRNPQKDPRLTDEISGVETAFIEQQGHFKISKITR